MRLAKYGVVLERLTSSEIELVRSWRNDSKINQYMKYRYYITQEMQMTWFESINNNLNYYFVININDKKIGLTEIKKIDYNEKTGESGIFIYMDECLNSIIPYQITCTLFDFAFYALNLEKIYSFVLQTNKRAIRFNKSLGFCEIGKTNDGINFYLTKESYEEYTKSIKAVIENNI